MGIGMITKTTSQVVGYQEAFFKLPLPVLASRGSVGTLREPSVELPAPQNCVKI